ncbi:MAG: [FeFe] hydrogenase H-cluster radical SAM maturase HydE [Victivallaceae bacterium]|nr:[FeFe] hydrogenase H-cluster radical SAM maturase HydE [Victivallaceae bacterium]
MPYALRPSELAFLLSLDDRAEQQELYAAAYEVKLRHTGNLVSLRGLIEMGNVCAKNCFYCGIRSGNKKVERFQLSLDEIENMALTAYRNNYGSVVLQAGEIESEARTEFVEEALRRIMKLSDGKLGVTLSLGEQTKSVYRRWREAGARRYLLRIESSTEAFYKMLHPSSHSYRRRRRCLELLRELDYQVGSGVMVGLPGQTVGQLVHDIRFFRSADLDMIGMGPYLPHPDTPLGRDIAFTPEYRAKQLASGLKMIAVTRLYLHDVNIASTTALQALAPGGREAGLLAGANVIMPNITDAGHRKNYNLYVNKPDADNDLLIENITAAGERINWGESGDSAHYFSRRLPR